jgi:hypothetical protein
VKDGGVRPPRGATAALKRTADGSDRSKTEGRSGRGRDYDVLERNDRPARLPEPFQLTDVKRSTYRLAGLGNR